MVAADYCGHIPDLNTVEPVYNMDTFGPTESVLTVRTKGLLWDFN